MPDPVSARRRRPLIDGAEPKHAQLRAVLAAMCATELAPDAAIPSERELMATYAVSRATVRRAIESLVAEGALRRVQGKGTFVAPPRVQSHLHLASFTQDMRRRGKAPVDPGRAGRAGRAAARGGRLVRAASRPDRPGGSSGCAWPPESRWPSRPAGTHRRCCPASTGTTWPGRSTSCSLQEYGVAVDTAEQTVRAELADATLAHHLDVEPGRPAAGVRPAAAAAAAPRSNG